MGCGIHVHVEIKINGEWHHWNHPNVERDYTLFGKMAGVRDPNVEPIVIPRGLPEDISFTTEFDAAYWTGDGHSHSYLTEEEMKELREWGKEQEKDYWWFDLIFGWLFGNSLDGLSEYPEDYPDGLEDVRLVFWFDN